MFARLLQKNSSFLLSSFPCSRVSLANFFTCGIMVCYVAAV